MKNHCSKRDLWNSEKILMRGQLLECERKKVMIEIIKNELKLLIEYGTTAEGVDTYIG